ncbi:MAG TPA: hypothetical protein VHY18_01845 [Solirubrobacteraceae bacterium]|nr:hypothetical protein [Solirubrobacteraceae bacterium]
MQRRISATSITTTYDRYGHLRPGAERESADRLSAYLDRLSGSLAPLVDSI